MSTVLSVRIPDQVEEKLRSLAAVEQRSLAEMFRLLAEEALKQREFPDVVFVHGPSGRRARLLGGPDIWEIIEPYVVAGRDWAALRESYPQLKDHQLRTAVRYYEAYPDEIDARLRLNLPE